MSKEKLMSILLWGVTLVTLIIGGLFIVSNRKQADSLTTKEAQMSKKNVKLKSDLKDLKIKNATPVFKPSKDGVKLSKTQSDTIDELTEVFTDLTTVKQSRVYAKRYREALTNLKVLPNNFFEYGFNDSRGAIRIDQHNLHTANISIFPDGDDKYMMILQYATYQGDTVTGNSEVRTQVINIEGHTGAYKKMTLDPRIEPNSDVRYYGEFREE